MANISTRHLPDISDSISGPFDFSESSFQIPTGANDSTDLLMAQDGRSFFNGIDQTLTTPAVSKLQREIASLKQLAEWTPNPTNERSAPTRYSLRPRNSIATPRRPALSKGIAAALITATPGNRTDASFEIPLGRANHDDLIVADNGKEFLGPGEADSPADLISPKKAAEASSTVLGLQPSSATPPISPIVGTERRDTHIPLSRKNSKPRPHLTTEDQRFSAASADVKIAAQPLESNNAAPRSEPEPISVDQEQEMIPNRSNTRRLSKKSAVTVVQKSVPRVKSKRAVVDGGISKAGKAKQPTSKLIGGSLTSTNGSVDSENCSPSLSAEPSVMVSVSAVVTQQTILSSKKSTSECMPNGLAEALEPAGQGDEQGVPVRSERLGYNGMHDHQALESSSLTSSSYRAPEASGSTPGQSAGKSRTQRADPDTAHEDMFTASHLSPVREDPTPKLEIADIIQGQASGSEAPASDALTSDEVPGPPSPMRTSTKRPASSAACATGVMGDKPSKKARGEVEQDGGAHNVMSDRALRPSRARNVRASALAPAFGSGLNSRARRAAPTHPTTVIRRIAADPSAKPPKKVTSKLQDEPSSRFVTTHTGGAKENNVQEGAAQLTDVALAPSSLRITGRSKDTRRPQRENVPEFEAAGGRLAQTLADGRTRKPVLKSSSSQQHVTSQPPAKPTIPIEFHFQSDLRIGARRPEGNNTRSVTTRSQSRKTTAVIPNSRVPRETSLTSRREPSNRIVPTQFTFHTEIRAHEREKFDEDRRKREQELEAELEEQRRLLALEEEKEIRELRKRAVPKANAVPSWYAHAPKKLEKTKAA